MWVWGSTHILPIFWGTQGSERWRILAKIAQLSSGKDGIRL